LYVTDSGYRVAINKEGQQEGSMAINRTLLSWSRAIHISLNHAATMTASPLTSMQQFASLPELPRDEQGQLAQSPELARFLRVGK